jgi:hypothetical protein
MHVDEPLGAQAKAQVASMNANPDNHDILQFDGVLYQEIAMSPSPIGSDKQWVPEENTDLLDGADYLDHTETVDITYDGDNLYHHMVEHSGDYVWLVGNTPGSGTLQGPDLEGDLTTITCHIGNDSGLDESREYPHNLDVTGYIDMEGDMSTFTTGSVRFTKANAKLGNTSSFPNSEVEITDKSLVEWGDPDGNTLNVTNTLVIHKGGRLTVTQPICFKSSSKLYLGRGKKIIPRNFPHKMEFPWDQVDMDNSGFESSGIIDTHGHLSIEISAPLWDWVYAHLYQGYGASNPYYYYDSHFFYSANTPHSDPTGTLYRVATYATNVTHCADGSMHEHYAGLPVHLVNLGNGQVEILGNPNSADTILQATTPGPTTPVQIGPDGLIYLVPIWE